MINNDIEDLNQVLEERPKSIIFHYLTGIGIMLAINTLFNYAKKEVYQAYQLLSLKVREMDLIVSNLEESIITKSDLGTLGFCNQNGHKIIKFIERYLIKEDLRDQYVKLDNAPQS